MAMRASLSWLSSMPKPKPDALARPGPRPAGPRSALRSRLLLLRARLVPFDLLRLHGGAEARVLRLHLALQVAAVVLLVHRASERPGLKKRNPDGVAV